MRDTMSPLQMAKWRAFRELQPDPMDRVCDILKVGFCAVANAFGAEYEPDDFEPAEEKKRPEPVASPNQAAALVQMQAGTSDGNSNR